MNIIYKNYEKISLNFNRDENNCLTWSTNFYDFSSFRELFIELYRAISDVCPGATLSKDYYRGYMSESRPCYRIVITFKNEFEEDQFILLCNEMDLR
jgi:hypothetical protein